MLELIFIILNVLATLLLPYRYIIVPILLGSCYMNTNSLLSIGPISFNATRILIAAGLVRIVICGVKAEFKWTGMDKLMVIWMMWIIISSLIHPGSNPIVFNLGQAYNIGGMYFLIRLMCNSTEDIANIIKTITIILIPIAIEMSYEQMIGKNIFSILGTSVTGLDQRDGRFRAQGPFAHAILAGNVGATCLPLVVSIYYINCYLSIIGIIACLIMVITCASSGPLMGLFFGLFALSLWRKKNLVCWFQRSALFVYFVLEIIMTRPAYFVISKIDLTGSSTGWHRARLIQSAIDHIDEWWIAGTDYTRHWMASGVSWSINHTDITNYYILMGIWGGVPLMILFMLMLGNGFLYVRVITNCKTSDIRHKRFMSWCIGSSLFAHACACVSVAYFDQTYIFIVFCVAGLSQLVSTEN